MNEAVVLSGRLVAALLAGIALLAFGAASVAAQEATPASGIAPTPEQTVTLATDVDATETTVPLQTAQREAPVAEAQQATGTVNITIQDGNLEPVQGACVLMESQSGADAYQCDGREDGVADGRLTFTLPPGDYTLVVARAPAGYISGTNIPFSLGAGLTVPVTIDLQPGGRTVFVNAVDQNGELVSEACFSIYTNAGFGRLGELVSSSCTPPPGDPDEGNASFPGIAPDNYIAVQTRVPTGYARAGDTPFTVSASGTGPIIVTVVSPTVDLSGDLIVNKVDEHGEPLAGACFAVHADIGGGQPGNVVAQQCDADDGQSDGTLIFTGPTPGEYVLAEYRAPDGYVTGGQRQVTIGVDTPTTVTVPNVPGGSEIAIRTVDPETGALLPGACFAVHRDNGSGQVAPGSFVVGRCDDSDGDSNGITPFTGLAAGDYLLVEDRAPEGYKVVSDTVPFSVDGIVDTSLTVENVPMTLAEQLVAVLKRILREVLG